MLYFAVICIIFPFLSYCLFNLCTARHFFLLILEVSLDSVVLATINADCCDWVMTIIPISACFVILQSTCYDYSVGRYLFVCNYYINSSLSSFRFTLWTTWTVHMTVNDTEVLDPGVGTWEFFKGWQGLLCVISYVPWFLSIIFFWFN